MKEVMGDLYENRASQLTVENFCCLSEGCSDLVGAGHAAGEAGQWAQDRNLLRRFMQRASASGEQRRSNVGPDQKNRGVGLQAFQQRNQGEEVPGAGGSEDCRDLAAPAIEPIGGETGRLFMTYD